MSIKTKYVIVQLFKKGMKTVQIAKFSETD